HFLFSRPLLYAILFSSNLKFLKMLKTRLDRRRTAANSRNSPAAHSDKKRQKKNRKGSVTSTVIGDTYSVKWRLYFWLHGKK
ncbi:hypothetical protein AALA36_24035, partial [Lachnospiraceae bacterium 66-29]